VPNVQGIGLEKTAVKLNAKGVPQYDPATAQTLDANGCGGKDSLIFVAGDASNFIPLLHEAADEGHIAGENTARVALGKAGAVGSTPRAERGAYGSPDRHRRWRISVVATKQLRDRPGDL
jgi:pyruvate/2-oxoglutarate dehydrogenase complex dihydrolipoamide dehydrogenase (E3) component